MAATSDPTWNEARSIHVGIDLVDDVYRGWLPPLASAEKDAVAMREMATSMGCSSRLLIGGSATRDAVVAALESVIERLVAGDLLLVTYAGHMTTLRGAGDDVDGWDEAWCLRDGVLLDDQLHDLLATVPEDVDVVVITDACFAAGITDLGPDDTTSRVPITAVSRTKADEFRSTLASLDPNALGAAELLALDHLATVLSASSTGVLMPRAPVTRQGDLEIGRLVREGRIPSGARRIGARRPIVANVVALGAAAEGSPAYEGDKQGLFTAALLYVLEGLGDEPMTHGDLMRKIAMLVRVQDPSLGLLGGGRAVGPSQGTFHRYLLDQWRREPSGQVPPAPESRYA